MGRSVGIVGSSGGGAATLASGAVEALSEYIAQLRSAAIDVCFVQFVFSTAPFDTVRPDRDVAELWVMGEGGMLTMAKRALVSEINGLAIREDEENARRVADGTADGLVMISADVRGANRRVFEASKVRGGTLAVVGTGGTSIGIAMAEGANVINGGGSVATTAKTRAIAFAGALASHWKLPYAPASPQAFQLHSVIDGCLPAFLAVFVAVQSAGALSALLRHAAADPAALLGPLAPGSLEANAPRVLCTVLAATAAYQAAALGELGLVAGALCGAFLTRCALAALFVGIACGMLTRRLLALAFGPLRFPATAASLFAAGGAGVVSGVLGEFAVVPLVAAAVDAAAPLAGVLAASPVAGALAGVLMVYGSQHGAYHLVFLPIILLEMERGQGALLGCLDEANLAVTSLALCSANVLAPGEEGGAAARAARRGAATNFLFGDYIEAAYPFMARDRAVEAAVYAGAALSGATCFAMGVRSSAYLPLPAAVLLSNRPLWCAACFAQQFLPPFLVQVAQNLRRRPKAA